MKTGYQIVVKDNKTDEYIYYGEIIYTKRNVFDIVDDMNYDFKKEGRNRTAYARRCTIIDD